MGRKRKDITPNDKDTGGKRQTKNKMATSFNSKQHNDVPVHTEQATSINQGNQSFSLPPVYPYTPSYVNLNSGSPVQLQQNIPFSQSSQQNDILQCILQRLDNVDQKLNQLNAIQRSITDITSRLNSMEVKITDIEKSQKFISDQYDTLSICADVNKQNIEHIQNDVKILKQENFEIKTENSNLKESLIDLKCRSMRENFLFFGLPEGSSQVKVLPSDSGRDINTKHSGAHQQPHNPAWSSQGHSIIHDVAASMTSDLPSTTGPSIENCVLKVFDFCERVLKISEAGSKLQVDRAHRIGSFMKGKIRPIVVKFKDTDSKLLVKNALKSINLKGSEYNVTEQFPPEVKERRKQLIPELIKARNQDMELQSGISGDMNHYPSILQAPSINQMIRAPEYETLHRDEVLEHEYGQIQAPNRSN